MICRHVVVIAVALVLAMASAAPAQPAAPGDPALLQQAAAAEALLTASDYSGAASAFASVLEQATWRGFDGVRARAFEGLAQAWHGAGQPDPARERASAALELYEQQMDLDGVARVSILLGQLPATARDTTAADRHFQRALEAAAATGNHRLHARALLERAELLRGTPAERAAALAAAGDEAEAAGDRRTEAEARHALGDLNFNRADYEHALAPLERAAAVYESLGLTVELGTVYNSLGRVYRAHGRLDEALRLQKAAVALHEQGGNPLFLLQSLNAVSVVYQRLNDYENARRYMERALAQVAAARSPLAEDFLQANLASMMLDQGEYEAAVPMLRAVIARGRDNYLAVRYGQISYALTRLGRGDAALAAAEQAVDLCGAQVETCANAYLIRSEALGALGRTADARRDAREAMGRLEGMRAGLVPTDYFKQNFYSSYSDGIGLAIAMQVLDGDGTGALETAENARSRAFLDLLASRSIASARTAGPAAGADEGGALAPAVRRTPQAQGAGASSVAHLAAAAARLQSTVVSYWVAKDAVFAWVVTSTGDVHVARVPVLRTALTALIAATVPATTSAAPSAVLATVTTRGARTLSAAVARPDAWRQLYTLLIAPLRAHLPRTPGALLTIVPHGPLQSLSFAALQDGRGRYLLEGYTLHYVSAGALLEFTGAQRRADARSGAMLLVADPATAPLSKLDRPLPRLDGARGEARAIARLVPARQVTTVSDRQAVAPQVRAEMAQKAVLHFATHAVVRDDDPFASYLALAPSSPGGSDGLLTAEAIYGLDLHADLVVLSACRSADGSISGDGVATFARAFVYAGAASIVASVWDVADEPTNRLLPGFYRAWLDGATKARALRRAQLALLADLRAGRVRVATPIGSVALREHPAFWAGFALFGEPE